MNFSQLLWTPIQKSNEWIRNAVESANIADATPETCEHFEINSVKCTFCPKLLIKCHGCR